MKNNFEPSAPVNQNTVERMSFPKAESFLATKARTLSHDYRNEHGQLEHCGLLAMDVARLILQEGGHPSMYSIRGSVIDSVGNRKSLTPKQYNGSIIWGGHTVCENQGLIYDPMVGRPVPLSQYLEETFTEPVTGEVSIPSNKIEDFVRR
jgi:hypothetical protein